MSKQPSGDDSLSLADRLALDRTALANERTLLAYVRTAIMLLVSGITLLKLFPESLAAQVPGWALLPLSVLVALVGVHRFLRVCRPLHDVQMTQSPSAAPPSPDLGGD